MRSLLPVARFTALTLVTLALLAPVAVSQETTAEKLQEPTIVPVTLSMTDTTAPLIWRYFSSVFGGERKTSTPRASAPLSIRLEVSSNSGGLVLKKESASLYRNGIPFGQVAPILCLDDNAAPFDPTKPCENETVSIDSLPTSITVTYRNPPIEAGKYDGFLRWTAEKAQDEEEHGNGEEAPGQGEGDTTGGAGQTTPPDVSPPGEAVAGTPPTAAINGTTDTSTGTDDEQGSKAQVLRFKTPFTLTVRDGLPLAIGVLVIGLGLGIGNTWYRSGQMKLDELYIDLDRLMILARDSGLSPDSGSCAPFWENVMKASRSLEMNAPKDAQKAIEAAQKALKACLAAIYARTSDAESLGAPARTRVFASRLLNNIDIARSRRQVFLVLSYIIAISLLCYFGLDELYYKNLTFGADPVDYIALFLWGFGAQASSAAVGKLVNGWNLPGLSRPTS